MLLLVCLLPILLITVYFYREFTRESSTVLVQRGKHPSTDPLRVFIIGGSGAGKSTLANQLTKALNLEHIELDILHWEPGWKRPAADDFKQNIRTAVQDTEERIKQGQYRGWVVDGNHRPAKEILW